MPESVCTLYLLSRHFRFYFRALHVHRKHLEIGTRNVKTDITRVREEGKQHVPGVLLLHVQTHPGATEGVRQADRQTVELDGIGRARVENWRTGEPVAEGLHFLGNARHRFPGKTCTERISLGCAKKLKVAW